MAEKINNAPSHRVFIVKGEGDNSRWMEIGVAWANRDGNGFAISLDALPVGGRIVMRAISGAGGQQ